MEECVRAMANEAIDELLEIDIERSMKENIGGILTVGTKADGYMVYCGQYDRVMPKSKKVWDKFMNIQSQGGRKANSHVGRVLNKMARSGRSYQALRRELERYMGRMGSSSFNCVMNGYGVQVQENLKTLVSGMRSEPSMHDTTKKLDFTDIENVEHSGYKSVRYSSEREYLLSLVAKNVSIDSLIDYKEFIPEGQYDVYVQEGLYRIVKTSVVCLPIQLQ